MSSKERRKRYEIMKKILSSFVGAAVGVVVIAMIWVSNIHAIFHEVIAFSDSIYYNVEVTYDEDETDSDDMQFYSLRLAVVSSFSEDYYEITYGENSGYVEDLLDGQSYILRVEVEKDIGWVSIEEKQVFTYKTLSAIVTDFYESTSLTNPYSYISFNVYLQEGYEEISSKFVRVTYGSELYFYDLSFGKNEIILDQIVHMNDELIIDVIVYIDEEEEILYETSYETTDYLDSIWYFYSWDLTSFEFYGELDYYSFENITYYLEIIDQNGTIETMNIDSLDSFVYRDDLSVESQYTILFYVTYGNETMQTVLLDEFYLELNQIP